MLPAKFLAKCVKSQLDYQMILVHNSMHPQSPSTAMELNLQKKVQQPQGSTQFLRNWSH